MSSCSVPPVAPSPWLGPPVSSQATAKSPLPSDLRATPAGCACGGNCECPGSASGVQPPALVLGNQCESSTGCACGTTPTFAPERDANGGSRALERAVTEWSKAKAKTTPRLRETTHMGLIGSFRVNPSDGSLEAEVHPPATGSFDPRPFLTYNSCHPSRNLCLKVV